MDILVDLKEKSYTVTVKNGGLKEASDYLDLNRRVFIITDDGIPKEYIDTLKAQCKTPYVFTLSQGEQSKSVSHWEQALKAMLGYGFTRLDCVVALGGGVAGDLSGFVASCYMRGIDFYNIPTTLLSQIDSSIGGKVAINLSHIKNAVGAFYQPKRVLIDTSLLSTLPHRHFANGLAEAVKISATCDSNLFELIEKDDIHQNMEKIIIRSLELKRDIIEQDEKEQNIRRVLNFGHTIGHGIESTQSPSLYHGECVALGMLCMCSNEVRSRLLSVYEKVGLPTSLKADIQKVFDAILHDKKSVQDGIFAIYVNEIGSYEIKETCLEEIKRRLLTL